MQSLFLYIQVSGIVTVSYSSRLLSKVVVISWLSALYHACFLTFSKHLRPRYLRTGMLRDIELRHGFTNP